MNNESEQYACDLRGPNIDTSLATMILIIDQMRPMTLTIIRTTWDAGV